MPKYDVAGRTGEFKRYRLTQGLLLRSAKRLWLLHIHSAAMDRLPIGVQRGVGAGPEHETAASWTELVHEDHGGDVTGDMVNVDIVAIFGAG